VGNPQHLKFGSLFGRPCTRAELLLPRNCFLGTQMSAPRSAGVTTGVDNIIWGNDFPASRRDLATHAGDGSHRYPRRPRGRGPQYPRTQSLLCYNFTRPNYKASPDRIGPTADDPQPAVHRPNPAEHDRMQQITTRAVDPLQHRDLLRCCHCGAQNAGVIRGYPRKRTSNELRHGPSRLFNPWTTFGPRLPNRNWAFTQRKRTPGAR